MNMKESKTSNMLGGKTARACDSCLVKRARWFCSADDAFLCQSCDGAVHSANQLASRHERVRLESSSCKASPQPAWLQGLTKKARTPRKAKPSRPSNHHHLPLVPEIGSDDPFPEENDENLFCRVPIFDEFTDDFFTEGVGSMVFDDDQEACGELNLEELAEFAADVESLLGAPPAGACGGDLEDYRDEIDRFPDKKRAKIEEIEDDEVEIACFHFTPNSSTIVEFGEETKKVDLIETAANIEIENESQLENRKLLRLDHEAVIAAWASQGSPWTDGIRPNFDLDEFMASCSEGRSDGMGGRKWAGREARVLRYREKRRTRLFSKKIRYEVRKLNAEKRPRMKGRFVKRTAFLGSSLPYHHQLINK